MKKILLFFLLIIPMFVNALSYENTSKKSFVIWQDVKATTDEYVKVHYYE